MKVKCISPRLNHVAFVTVDGKKKARRVEVGDVFSVKAIPAEWRGLVVALETEAKQAVTNPANEALEALKAEYKEKTGKAAHHSWDAEAIKAKLDEAAQA